VCCAPATSAPNVSWTPYATLGRLQAEPKHFEQGYSNRWISDKIVSCHAYDGKQVILRVTIGTYVDYFKLIGNLCDVFAGVGRWYHHSYVGTDGPWKAVNGNHSALLGGFFPYAPDDKRAWGPFWGAPAGPTGYHAEGGGCCDNGDGIVRFWQTTQIDIHVIA